VPICLELTPILADAFEQAVPSNCIADCSALVAQIVTQQAFAPDGARPQKTTESAATIYEARELKPPCSPRLAPDRRRSPTPEYANGRGYSLAR